MIRMIFKIRHLVEIVRIGFLNFKSVYDLETWSNCN